MPKTREQIAHEIGISVTTMWRKMKAHNLSIPRGLVFPESERRIYSLFRLSDFEGHFGKEMKGDEKK